MNSDLLNNKDILWLSLMCRQWFLGRNWRRSSFQEVSVNNVTKKHSDETHPLCDNIMNSFQTFIHRYWIDRTPINCTRFYRLLDFDSRRSVVVPGGSAKSYDDSISASAHPFLLSFYSRPRIVESASLMRSITSDPLVVPVTTHRLFHADSCNYIRAHCPMKIHNNNSLLFILLRLSTALEVREGTNPSYILSSERSIGTSGSGFF